MKPERWATVFYMPPTDGPLVSTKAAWGADNGAETCVFVTQEEAIDFAWRRWRVPRERVRIQGQATCDKCGAPVMGTRDSSHRLGRLHATDNTTADRWCRR